MQEYDSNEVLIELSIWKLLFALLLRILGGSILFIFLQTFYFAAEIFGGFFLWSFFFLLSFGLILIIWQILKEIRILFYLRKAFIRLDELGFHHGYPKQVIPWHNIKRVHFRKRKWVLVVYQPIPSTSLKRLLVMNYFKIKPKELHDLLKDWQARNFEEGNKILI